MRRRRRGLQNPCQLQALLALLSITSILGLQQTIQLYRKSASLDSNPQRRLNNVLYYGVMQLGTPGQELTVCPDTGSAAVWTAAGAVPLKQSGNTNEESMYNGFVSNASSTFQVNGYNFSEKYSTGGVIGVLASDTVELGDINISNASLGLVTEASVDLTGASCAGVLGLGRPGLVTPGTAIFYTMLAQQGLLDAPTFSLWLSPDPAAEPAGSLMFGGADSSLYTGTLTPVPVISSKYWMVPLVGMQAGGSALPITARGALLDSSAALSLVTDRDFLALQSLPGVSYSGQSGAFQIIGGCANISSLPNLTITLGSSNFTLTPQQYVVQLSSTACALGFQPGAPDNTLVLGTTFLRAHFTAYTYNATSRSSYVSFAPAAPGNITRARRRSVQELGGYPSATPVLGGTPADSHPVPLGLSTGVGDFGLPTALPPQPGAAEGVAADDSSQLGNAADQTAALAAALAVAAAARAPASAPASAPVSSVASALKNAETDAGGAAAAAAAAGAAAPQVVTPAVPASYPPAALLPTALPFTGRFPAAAPVAAPQAAPPVQAPASFSTQAPAPASSPAQAPAQASPLPASAAQPVSAAAPQAVGSTQAPAEVPSQAPVLGIDAPSAELFPEQVQAAPVQAPKPAPVNLGINAPSADLFPEQVQTAPVQASMPAPQPAPALSAAPAEVQAMPVQAPAPAPVNLGVSAPSVELFPEQVLAAPVQAPAPAQALPNAIPPAAAPAQQALPAPAPPLQAAPAGSAPGSPPVAGPAAAPQLQPIGVTIPVMPLLPARAPAPAAMASAAPPVPAEQGPVASYSLAAPAPAPAATVAQQPTSSSIPVMPLVAAPVKAPPPSPTMAVAAVAATAAPAIGPSSYPSYAPALAPAASTQLQPEPVIIPVTALSMAPVSAPAPAPAAVPAAAPALAATAAAGAPAPTVSGAVSAFSLPAQALAPATPPLQAPQPAAALVVAPAAAPAAGPISASAPAPAAAFTTASGPSVTGAPALGPAAVMAAAPELAPLSAPALAPAPSAAAANGAAPAPSLALPSIAPFLAPAPAPLAAAPTSSRGPFGSLFPAGTGSAEVQPPFQAVPGLEVLYGGLGSLWRLPLQQSSTSDALFDRYLAAHPLSVRQNRTLAKPKPPTPPGFGQPVNLVVLDQYMDTCVVGWSSVNSCRAKGLNETSCALMPVFNDVDTVQYQCPFKNETQVQLPADSGNFVPVSQQWLLVRPGTHGQQIYNVGLGKCLDICTEQADASLCGHAGNVYLQDCDSASPTQQWLLSPAAMANATFLNANAANLTAYQISNAYVPPVADSAFGQAPQTQTCMDTCEAERDAEILPSAYGQTTCNDLLPTHPSSAAVFPCTAQRLPHSISQGFAIVFAPGPSSA